MTKQILGFFLGMLCAISGFFIGYSTGWDAAPKQINIYVAPPGWYA